MAIEKLKTAASRLWQFFSALPAPQKIFLVGSVIAVLASVAFVFYKINKPEYALLYGRIPEKDLATVVEYLKQQKIPYKIEADKIYVPKDRLYDVRLSMAKEGIPKGTGVGFEIFDEQKLGSTEFVQKVNYQRALQGELARTISKMDKVEDARVHLVLPEETLFVEDEKPPTASVVIKLRDGAKLSSREIQGIVHLVSNAVRGLTDEHITIVSTDGKVLYKKDAIQSSFQLTELQLNYKQRLEQELQRKVQSMLSSVLGENDVIVRVSADVDFSQVKVTENIFDPDSAVIRSQQRSIEKSKGLKKGPKGNPDVPINVESKLLVSKPPKEAGEAGEQSFERQEEITNYEMNKTLRQIILTPGSIKRLSVAVIVDGPYKEEKTGKNMIKKIFVGRSEKELKAIEDVVKKAIGFNSDRGDQITVSNIPFASELIPQPAPPNRWIALLKENQKILLNVLIAILIFFFVIRPFMKKIDKIVVEGPPQIPTEEVPSLPEEEVKPKALTPKQQAIVLVQEQPEKAAEIIKAWLGEEA